MNYTDNYRLPQWEENDRILRADFNKMCRDIDCGISGERAVSSARIRRMAYNHFCLVRETDPLPRQLGVFFRKFNRNYGPTEMLRLDGGCVMGQASEIITSNDFINSFQSNSIMNVVKDTSASYIEVVFTSPGPGRIKSIPYSGNYSMTDGSKGPCVAALVNLETGIQEVSQEVSLNIRGSMSSVHGYLAMDLPFRGGCRYRLRIVPTAKDYNASLKFEPSGNGNNVEFYNIPAAAMTYRMQTEETSRGGMVIVQHNSWGEHQLRLLWDGEETPLCQLLTASTDGRGVQEAVFYRDGPVSEESELRLELTCGPGGDIELYSWGAILL